MWWDPDTIDRAVTRQFVCSHLLPDEIERLDRPLGFGDGLTDGTYWEWIDEKARRIFLILVDLGVPDQIFGVIDDSWDDEDLPVAKDQVDRLALTAERDEKMERRFYQRQFYYLLRPLQKGEHKVYQDNEVVPLDVVEKKTLAAGQTHNHPVDKVVLPGHPDMVFCRRRVPLACGFGQGYMSQEDFLYEVNNIRNVQNDHLVSYWASYVHQGYGYVLFTPATDSSLKSFLTTTPAWMKNLDKRKQRELVMNWIHCLVDTLCFLHNRGLSHGNIRPSTVLFSGENIFFSDFTIFNPEALTGGEKNSFDKEAYDYAAPEQWFRPTSGPPSPIHRRATLSMLSTSPDNYSFAISRSLTDYGPNSPMAMMHAPTPHLNPQAADVFSLGCVILELLSFLLKKQGRPFATYRAAKHKTPGRGGAVPDSSFHKNLGQVESWMTQLAKDASKKDDQVFRGVSPMLHVVERILSLHPSERPAAHDVQARLYNILTDACGISEPHCVHQYGGWDFGIGSLKLDSPTLVRNNSNDTMSIATKRSSGSGSSLDYKRMSGGSTTVRRTGSISTQAREAPPAEAPRDRTSKMPHDLGSSLRAIQNLRLRDKVRPWQSPVHAEMGVLTCNT